MTKRIDQIMKLIQEEARERTGANDYPLKLYDVKLDVDIRVSSIVKAILDEERKKSKTKGGA